MRASDSHSPHSFSVIGTHLNLTTSAEISAAAAAAVFAFTVASNATSAAAAAAVAWYIEIHTEA